MCSKIKAALCLPSGQVEAAQTKARAGTSCFVYLAITYVYVLSFLNPACNINQATIPRCGDAGRSTTLSQLLQGLRSQSTPAPSLYLTQDGPPEAKEIYSAGVVRKYSRPKQSTQLSAPVERILGCAMIIRDPDPSRGCKASQAHSAAVVITDHDS